MPTHDHIPSKLYGEVALDEIYQFISGFVIRIKIGKVMSWEVVGNMDSTYSIIINYPNEMPTNSHILSKLYGGAALDKACQFIIQFYNSDKNWQSYELKGDFDLYCSKVANLTKLQPTVASSWNYMPR
jgi:hypothetical protein